ncbi:MAG: hypothetical protein ACYTFI_26455 [Planctomycetota bacterium]
MPWLFKYYVAQAYAYTRPRPLAEEGGSLHSPCLPEYQPTRSFFGDSIDDILKDKVATTRMKVEGLLAQIEQRKDLSKYTHHAIGEDICECDTKLMGLENIPLNYSKEANKLRSSLYQQSLALEQEKRREYLNYWRDLVQLRNDLVDAIADYRETSRRDSRCRGDSYGS